MATEIESTDLDAYIVTDLVTPPTFFNTYEAALIQAQTLTEKTGRDFYLFSAGQKFLGEHPYNFNDKNFPFYMVGDGDFKDTNPFDPEQVYYYASSAFQTPEDAEKDCAESTLEEDGADVFTPVVYQVTPLYSLERTVKYKRSY